MSTDPPSGTVKPMTSRPRSDAMEPSLSPRIERRDTEPCEQPEEGDRRPTQPPTLAELAADAEHYRIVREAGQEAAGILSSSLTEILTKLSRVDANVAQIRSDMGRLSDLEERVARIERCCLGCPRAGEHALGAVDGHG